jgi:hypothetical protein
MVCRSWGRDARTAPFFVHVPLVPLLVFMLLSRHGGFQVSP